MAEFIEKSKMKQYVKNFFTGLKVDGDKFDEEDCCETICQIIDFAPAADVVEVVRCRDCKRCSFHEFFWTCKKGQIEMLVKPNGFCDEAIKRRSQP